MALRVLLLSVLSSMAFGLVLHTEEEHPWPTSRGPHLKQFGVTNIIPPENLSASLAWSWHHPRGRYHTVLCGGALIDVAGNFYLAGNDGVRKLSPSGQELWHFEQHDKLMNNQPALLGDKVFGSNQHGEAFAIDMKTGTSVWRKQLAQTAGGDCGYPAAYDGVFAVGAEEGKVAGHGGGNVRVFGLDAASGSRLWEFKPQMPVWNFAPLFPGDDTCVFMDFSGGMYRLGLHNGTLLWHVPVPGASKSFSDGGATLGPNGAVYSCSNPGNAGGSEGTKGLLRALRLADGALMWEQLLPQPCNSYPAVGPLSEGHLSVAVTPGSFMGAPNLHGSIVAFDATTGALEWRFNTKPYTGPFYMARGDVEGALERKLFNSAAHSICLPAHWSSANIAGDGTVLAARCDGHVYAVRGPALPPDTKLFAKDNAQFDKADFESTPGTVARLWNAHGASLHGAFAFAPGKMAVMTCDTLYVFRV